MRKRGNERERQREEKDTKGKREREREVGEEMDETKEMRNKKEAEM